MTDYDWIGGVERLETYKPGGYHPVMIGDAMHTRYTIIDKQGFGGYSTV
jgi:serine/threonine-protein kinase SRPK3